MSALPGTGKGSKRRVTKNPDRRQTPEPVILEKRKREGRRVNDITDMGGEEGFIENGPGQKSGVKVHRRWGKHGGTCRQDKNNDKFSRPY